MGKTILILGVMLGLVIVSIFYLNTGTDLATVDGIGNVGFLVFTINLRNTGATELRDFEFIGSPAVFNDALSGCSLSVLNPGQKYACHTGMVDINAVPDGEVTFEIEILAKYGQDSRTLTRVLTKTLNIKHVFTDYLRANPLIKARVNGLDNITRTYFYDYITELESSGAIDVPLPAMSGTTATLTAEAQKRIIAAKLAHSLWLDKHKVFPWRLSDYTAEELDTLYSPEYLFSEYGSVYNYLYLVDHSPSETYNISRVFAGASTDATVYALLDYARANFRHGGITEDRSITTLAAAMTNRDNHDKLVSRRGCHTMSLIIAGLARSLNIPAYYDTGWYSGTAHGSVIFPGKYVLNHGDDVYASSLTSVPTRQLLMPWAYFVTEVEPCGKRTPCAMNATRRYNLMNTFKYKNGYLISRCCDPAKYHYDSCRDFFDGGIGAVKILTESELNEKIAEVELLC